MFKNADGLMNGAINPAFMIPRPKLKKKLSTLNEEIIANNEPNFLQSESDIFNLRTFF